MKNRGILIVVSAPSGCGKGTILSEILKDDSFYYSVSATTRQPRDGEIDGINYHFITKNEFEDMINSGGMLEYAVYCDNYYGTPKNKIMEMLDSGRNVILEIEVQGAMKIKKICPDGLFIFINPPSAAELKRRLKKRGTESEEVISKRVSEAEKEMKYSNEYDYIIVNGVLEDAIADFRAIVRAEQLRTKRKNLNSMEVK